MPNHPPRLVAVSKYQPVSAIIEAYEAGQRHFGENYIQELVEKSASEEILNKCPDIKFHFIGHLQSNKINKLFKVNNLYMFETLDSLKLCDSLEKALENRPQQYLKQDDKLKVLIQVNTSGEEQKNGLLPDEVPHLAEHIVSNSKFIKLAGLMTIGKNGGWPGQVNQDFVRLYQVRDELVARLSLNATDLHLSMGMSADFEEAIRLGSTSVRIGSMIFGERPPKPAERPNFPVPSGDTNKHESD